MDEDNIKVTFVVSSNYESEEQTSNEMQQAFAACKQNSIVAKWCYEKECLELATQKTDFFVFEVFCGQVFEKIKETKSVRILGPWCLLTCLTEGKPIPNFPWPINSVAMIGCTITFSSLTKQEKQYLQEKVMSMGGYVSNSLTESCTHVVTNSVKSEKYIKGAEAGKKIMLSSWINDVWDASLKGNVHCNNERFNKHICPVFHKLVICCTGLSNVQRHDLCQNITDNGGIYKEQLHIHNTDILVTESRTPSAKYKAAQKHNIKCVNMSWVLDSVKNGYAMPDNLYRIHINTSTPTKDTAELPNFSMISHIGNTSELLTRTEVSESINCTTLLKTMALQPSSSLKRKSNSNEHNELVDEIVLKDVKRAGSFLDGCGIYLVGFGAEQREKLCKIINFSGATRYNDISDRVTHIIAGDVSCPELKNLRLKNRNLSCPIVSVHWLLKSMAEESPANEENFIISRDTESNNEPSSPLTKKSLHLMNTSVNVTDTKESTENMSALLDTADILQQYFQPDSSSQEDTLARLLQENSKLKTVTDNSNLNEDNQTTLNNEKNDKTVQKSDTIKMGKPQPVCVEKPTSLSSAIDDDSSQSPAPVFQDLKFVIVGFAPEERKQIKVTVEAMAGTVVSKSYKGVCDYAVVPTFGSSLKHAATNIVNDLWITECWHECEIRPIHYFHQPLSVNNDVKPLENCVLTISGYTNYERNFLKMLISELGGICQESLSRLNSKSGLLACTHLISSDASGKKYVAAVKWGLCVTNKDWLLECARTSEYAPVDQFLVVDTTLLSNNTTEINKPMPSTTVPENNESVFKLNKLSLVNSQSVDATKPEERSSIPEVQSINDPKSDDNTPKYNKKWNTSGITASQITPVQKILTEARRRNLLDTPVQNLPCSLPCDQVDTPDTPLGAFIRPNPSPRLRKEMVRYLNTFPDYKPRRDSTPLSELKRQLWDKICPPKDGSFVQPNFNTSDEEALQSDENAENVSTPPNRKLSIPESVFNNQLKQLQEMMTASGGARSESKRSIQLIPPATSLKNSQPNTVGWDDEVQTRVFMFSGVSQEKRVEMSTNLEKLGGVMIQSINFDPSSTHLLCATLSRNEKILASMSTGKWILHESYVDECVAQKTFVDEEIYEFGNPRFCANVLPEHVKESDRLFAAHFWRKEVARRGYGAFHDMRFIVVALKREPLVRVLEAGGGVVIDESPPFEKPINATHCLLDLKYLNNLDVYIPLAKQGVYCVNTLFVSDYLSKPDTDVRDFIIPYFLDYYNS